MKNRFWAFVLTGVILSVPIFSTPVDNYYKGYYQDVVSDLTQKSVLSTEETFLLANTYSKLGDDGGLADVLPKLSASRGVYRQYANLLRLRSLILKDQNKEAEQYLRSAVQNFENPFIDRLAAYELAVSLFNRGEIKKADDLVTSILRLRPDRVVFPKMLELKIKISIQRGLIDETVENYGKLIANFPSYDKDDVLWNRILEVFRIRITKKDALKTPEQTIVYLKNLFREKKFVDVVSIGQQFTVEYPQDRYVSEVYYLVGLSQLALNRFASVVDIFRKVETSTEDVALIKNSLYYRGLGYYKLQEWDNAAQMFKEYLRVSNVSDTFREKSYYYLLDIYQQQGPFKEYSLLSRHLAQDFPNSIYLKKLQYNYKWLALSDMVEGTQEDKSRFYYLLGSPIVGDKMMAFYKSEKEKSTRYVQDDPLKVGVHISPVSFYAKNVLFTKFTGKSDASDKGRKALGNFSNTESALISLYNSGFGDLYLDNIEFNISIGDYDPTPFYTEKAIMLSFLGRYRDSIDQFYALLDPQDVENGTFPSELIPYLFPRPFSKEVKLYSEKFNVPPALILAVMREESKFDPNAISSSSARGLMQLTSRTAQDVAVRNGETWRNNEALFEPNTNIRYGTFYLSWLLKQFDNQIGKTACAYNAGPTATRNWLKRFDEDAFVKFIEEIPYPEARDYAKRVLNSYLIYSL